MRVLREKSLQSNVLRQSLLIIIPGDENDTPVGVYMRARSKTIKKAYPAMLPRN